MILSRWCQFGKGPREEFDPATTSPNSGPITYTHRSSIISLILNTFWKPLILYCLNFGSTYHIMSELYFIWRSVSAGEAKWKLLHHVWLCDPMGYTVQGILQARILEWVVAFSFSRESSQPGNQTEVSCIAGRFFTSWATKEAYKCWSHWVSWHMGVIQVYT